MGPAKTRRTDASQLHTPFGFCCQVGSNIVADAGPAAYKNIIFLFPRIADVFDPIAKIAENEKIELISNVFLIDLALYQSQEGCMKFHVVHNGIVYVDLPFFISADGIKTSEAILFGRKKIAVGKLPSNIVFPGPSFVEGIDQGKGRA